jgi:hypothetical protein
MKPYLSTIVVVALLHLPTWVEAATRGDVRVLEASDNMRYTASALAREYILYARYPTKKELRQGLQERLQAFEQEMHEIATSTKDARTRGILKYFALEKERLADLLGKQPDPARAAAMIAFEEGVLEGTQAINQRHTYVPSPEEDMWITTRMMTQMLEAMIAYYGAQKVISDDPELKKKMAANMQRFSEALKRINAYKYEDQALIEARTRINRLWETLGAYLRASDSLSIPLLSAMMARRLEMALETLGNYHSKNQ